MKGEGQLRAEALLRTKALAKAKTYAGLGFEKPSRQVQRRIARKSVKHGLGREEFNRVKRAAKR